MTLLGINNPNSRYNRNERRQAVQPQRTIRTTVTRGDLEVLADVIAQQYKLALIHNIEVKAREFEAQLSLVAEWADLL